MLLKIEIENHNSSEYKSLQTPLPVKMEAKNVPENKNVKRKNDLYSMGMNYII